MFTQKCSLQLGVFPKWGFGIISVIFFYPFFVCGGGVVGGFYVMLYALCMLKLKWFWKYIIVAQRFPSMPSRKKDVQDFAKETELLTRYSALNSPHYIHIFVKCILFWITAKEKNTWEA